MHNFGPTMAQLLRQKEGCIRKTCPRHQNPQRLGTFCLAREAIMQQLGNAISGRLLDRAIPFGRVFFGGQGQRRGCEATLGILRFLLLQFFRNDTIQKPRYHQLSLTPPVHNPPSHLEGLHDDKEAIDDGQKFFRIVLLMSWFVLSACEETCFFFSGAPWSRGRWGSRLCWGCAADDKGFRYNSVPEPNLTIELARVRRPHEF